MGIEIMAANSERSPTEALYLKDYLIELCDNPWILDRIGSIDMPDANPVIGAGTARAIRHILRRSEVVLWKSDLWNAAMNGALLFAESTLSGKWCNPWAENRAQLWVFSPPHTLDPAWAKLYRLDVTPDEFDVVAMLVFQRESSTKTGVVKIMIPNIKEGSAIRQGMPDRKVFDAIAPMFRFDMSWQAAAGIEFMSASIVRIDKHAWPRPERRRAIKADRILPEVNVIGLRRLTDGASPTINSNRDWQHQWIVSGHWRNQWYSKTEEHRPVFIAPHVKGPDDKPLLPPRKSIYAVLR